MFVLLFHLYISAPWARLSKLQIYSVRSVYHSSRLCVTVGQGRIRCSKYGSPSLPSVYFFHLFCLSVSSDSSKKHLTASVTESASVTKDHNPHLDYMVPNHQLKACIMSWVSLEETFFKSKTCKCSSKFHCSIWLFLNWFSFWNINNQLIIRCHSLWEKIHYNPHIPRGIHPSISFCSLLYPFLWTVTHLFPHVLHSVAHCFGRYSGRNTLTRNHEKSNWFTTFSENLMPLASVGFWSSWISNLNC